MSSQQPKHRYEKAEQPHIAIPNLLAREFDGGGAEQGLGWLHHLGLDWKSLGVPGNGDRFICPSAGRSQYHRTET